PSEVDALVVCFYDYEAPDQALEARRRFCRLAVHCAVSAHQGADLTVLGLATGEAAAEEAWGANGGRVWGWHDKAMSAIKVDMEGCFTLGQLLEARDDVVRSLIRLGPHEIVLRSLASFPERKGGKDNKTLVRLSLRFVFVAEGPQVSGRGGPTVAAANPALLFECVYGTSDAVERMVWYHRKHSDINPAKQYEDSLCSAAVEAAGRQGYLEAYRRLLRLRSMGVDLGSLVSTERRGEPQAGTKEDGDSEVETSRGRVLGRGKEEPDNDHTAAHPDGTIIAKAILCMLQGPAERLDHACCTMSALQLAGAVLDSSPAPSSYPHIKRAAVQAQAEYAVSCLLKTLAEQPPTRFEGAVEAVKARSQLLLQSINSFIG
ncbi:unnamed protein product, partial [Discosporangium mesarthrocarpum]